MPLSLRRRTVDRSRNHPAGSTRRPARRPYGPRLELLEDRLAPAAVSWDGGGGSDTRWANALNWSNNLLPTAADDVTINAPGVTVIHDSLSTETVHSLQCQSAALFRITG